MDALYTASVRFATTLQSGPPWLEKFWVTVTSLADPKSIFTVFFPLAYFLDRSVGVSVLWTGLVAEWLNVVLKWFLFGERLFWWVHESGLASTEPIALRQFPVSCETGPGSPSGHCMITGAALWPLVTTLTALASTHCRSEAKPVLPGTVHLEALSWTLLAFQPGGEAGPLWHVRAAPARRGALAYLCPGPLPPSGGRWHPGWGCPGLEAAGPHPGRPDSGLLHGHCAGPAARRPGPAQAGDRCRHRHRLVHPSGHQMVHQPRLAAPRHPALRLRVPRCRQCPGLGAGCGLPAAPGAAPGLPAASGWCCAGPGCHAGPAPAAAASECDPVVRHQLPQVHCWALAGGIAPAPARPPHLPMELFPHRVGVPPVSW
ncbi:glucose-6-phosphatase 3 isoform X1 [Cuculus canorus]|uniref:glucose-6-phosphatase 3 isoform X1 n=1 Tax=Cuculus canorus TaxID=55661 RepID=UPI0023AA9D63|nr:glucose-6-phosphatase 3 isoform X1 [Cuculus canorus]